MITNVTKLSSYIARFEGKKHQASIGDIREIVGILSDAFHKDDGRLYKALLKNGVRRAKRNEPPLCGGLGRKRK